MKKEDDCTGKAVQGTEEILFTNASSVVSSRILYTPSAFARTSLLHLQEIGSLEAIQPHTSARENLVSYLCFVVTGGCGELLYNKKKYKLCAGDELLVSVPRAREPDIIPEDIPLSILYEDDDVLVVDKPKGMVVHPAPGHYSGTLVNAVLYHCKGRLSGINGIMRPGIVHRVSFDM